MPDYDFRSPRLYVTAALSQGGEVALDKTQANYLRNVLRLGTEAEVLVFNGRDGEWRARLGGSGKAALLRVVDTIRPQPPASTLTYAFAPLKHARLDYMVQKAVEMGAGVLQPVLTQHTQVARVNTERMRANAIEAAEQCGILHLVAVREPLRLDALLADLPVGGLLVFCDEHAPVADPFEALRAVAASAADARPVTVLIGPEGGFDARERAALLRAPGAVRLALGPRILRADTAAVAALAVVQAAIGDWGAGSA